MRSAPHRPPATPPCEARASDCIAHDVRAANVSKVYYHVDKSVASEAYTISRGRWGISPNLVKASDEGGKKKRAKGEGDGGGRQHRVAALNLPARPNTQGEHWTISSPMIT